jgi:hypothetical protein
VSTLLVQQANEPPFRISCTIESKFSRCVPLPKGESFDAKKEKHGLAVYYVDDRGKERKQLYALVDADGKAGPSPTAAAAATEPVPRTAPGLQNSPAPAPPPTAPPSRLAEKDEKVKCSFTSTPAGGEINLDGKYVGSTPSEIAVAAGAHIVIFSMPGFTSWQRELTVLPGSELTVSAILQK